VPPAVVVDQNVERQNVEIEIEDLKNVESLGYCLTPAGLFQEG
jgi:hypothetical protein